MTSEVIQAILLDVKGFSKFDITLLELNGSLLQMVKFTVTAGKCDKIPKILLLRELQTFQLTIIAFKWKPAESSIFYK